MHQGFKKKKIQNLTTIFFVSYVCVCVYICACGDLYWSEVCGLFKPEALAEDQASMDMLVNGSGAVF